MSATSTYTTTPSRLAGLRRKGGGGIGGIVTASTPNLKHIFSAHSKPRKSSLAAPTPNSLGAIPDESAYDDDANTVLTNMPPHTPARPATAGGEDGNMRIGDTVDVPGSMVGTVRFIGAVQGRKGTFAGVELMREFAARGKNNGDVDGISYFTTTQPGAGIFLPLSKAIRRDSPTSATSFMTPHTTASGLKPANQNSTNFTPPTPSIPKFSQSVGPGRAPSPVGRKPPRTSLPRPESPVRRLQLMPAAVRPSIATPGPKMAGGRYGSPKPSNFSQSVRGTAGDPNKRFPVRERKPSMGPRSASALSFTPAALTDEETTPVAQARTKTNGGVGFASSTHGFKRPLSRAMPRANSSEEVERLRAQLEDRDRQLREQAATLQDMESSLTELTGLLDNSDGIPPPHSTGQVGVEDKDVAQLRAILREKNEKIAMLTAEFDAHRADFRSTIDTLELASAETERVYDKKIEDLVQELEELHDRTADVDVVAAQLKQLEELVQELEEGLEDARRGEAEARGEVEFLRGEVERTRTELRREREKAREGVTANGGSGVNGTNGTNGTRAHGDKALLSKELEQKDDEIRGLKAIIHSLSRDTMPNDSSDKTATQHSGPSRPCTREPTEDRTARERLEREVAELRAMVENKRSREEELQSEMEKLKRPSGVTTPAGSNNRDSHATVVAVPNKLEKHVGHGINKSRVQRRESDTYSIATEDSTLWCEVCDVAGHDILTCTIMFEDDQLSTPTQPTSQPKAAPATVVDTPATITAPAINGNRAAKDAVREGIKSEAVPAGVKMLPNPMESGPLAGKESGVIDMSRWCAVCERDGHDSVDCPFEDGF